MYEYKVHTQGDKMLSGRFDRDDLENVLNGYATDGWRLSQGFMVASLWKSMKAEIVLILERPTPSTGGPAR